MLHIVWWYSPIGDEREHQSHQGQTTTQDNDETQHAILIEGTSDPSRNAIGYSTAGLRKAVNNTGVKCLHIAVTSTSVT